MAVNAAVLLAPIIFAWAIRFSTVFCRCEVQLFAVDTPNCIKSARPAVTAMISLNFFEIGISLNHCIIFFIFLFPEDKRQSQQLGTDLEFSPACRVNIYQKMYFVPFGNKLDNPA